MPAHNADVTAEMCELFGCEPNDNVYEVARRVFEIAKDYTVGAPDDFAPGAAQFLANIGRQVATVLHAEERRVDAPKRIESIVRSASTDCERLQAPGILLAVNPLARISGVKADADDRVTATIGQLHQLARLQVIKELEPFVRGIFQRMVDYHQVVDTSRTLFSRYN